MHTYTNAEHLRTIARKRWAHYRELCNWRSETQLSKANMKSIRGTWERVGPPDVVSHLPASILDTYFIHLESQDLEPQLF
jgi:hypothetical protein